MRARALVRPCAGRRRRSAEKPGLFLPRWLARPGPPRAVGPPRHRSSGSGPAAQSGPLAPSEMANFVSGFSAANKCLPDSGGRRTCLTPLFPPNPVFFKSSFGLHCVYSFMVCEKVRWVTWSNRQFFSWYRRQKTYAGMRILLVALVEPACLVVRTVLRPSQI